MYNFYITANADGSGYYDDGLTGEFDIINAKGKVGVDGLASTKIQWNSGASAHIYYVWLEATDNGGCTNRINIQITPQINKFDLLSENIPVDNTMSCPAVASTDGFNPLASAYDAGTTTLKFIVRRLNGTDNKQTALAGDTYDWSFQPVLSVNPAYNTGISIVSIVGVNSGKLTSDVNNLYLVKGTDSEVTVTVAVKNVPGVSQDVKLSIKNQSESRSNLLDSNSSNDSVQHRIEVLPVIDSLQGV
ncbi:hypothetical protein AQPE_1833 [Aquipluma nitroreducens]|uniref:Uncharacterized protein n=1 Tax=Aquipluma nitroreducens TaxID=2010828 RepID=A0A5K7S818_9BACT|nr:hypothetical protein AQPE_1833 [Aquipluma nitroreducens]